MPSLLYNLLACFVIAVVVAGAAFGVGVLQTGTFDYSQWPNDVKGHLGTLWCCMSCILAIQVCRK